MEKYLGSGLIRGIGPTFAQRLVSAFRETVFEVIEHAPQRLLEVEGIGPKRARRITASWADQKVIREIMAFLQGHGVSTSRAVRVASDRCRASYRMGREEIRGDTCGESAGGGRAGAGQQIGGRDRWARGGQNNSGEFHPQDT